jgi:hypothetical protein
MHHSWSSDELCQKSLPVIPTRHVCSALFDEAAQWWPGEVSALKSSPICFFFPLCNMSGMTFACAIRRQHHHSDMKEVP